MDEISSGNLRSHPTVRSVGKGRDVNGLLVPTSNGHYGPGDPPKESPPSIGVSNITTLKYINILSSESPISRYDVSFR
jgi:hypothetical protein